MEEKFLILGILYSCGSIKSKSKIEFQTKRKEFAEILRSLMGKLGNLEIKVNDNFIVIIKNKRLEEKFGKIDKNKLPIELLDSEEKIKSFLKGYFEGKSSISVRKRLIKVSGKKEILEQLKLLLEKENINAKIYKTGKYCSLYIEGKNKCKNFMDKIGFISKEKNELLQRLVLYY
jgi:hypothetical protein